MNNLKEFKELISRYESITLNDINNVVFNKFKELRFGAQKAKVLTSFSSFDCTLCVPIDEDCSLCVWDLPFHNVCCCCEDHKPTYNSIYYAENDKELLKAFKERAKYMRKVLKEKRG